jgi:NDP-4-keto-2,6-dideoxyhexose 3-C-methyltransferase
MRKKVQQEIKRIDSCRVCRSEELTPLFSLGDQYVNNFIEADQLDNYIIAPLELVFCESCTLVQLRHTAPQELLYSGFYWYKSGVTQTMRDALQDVARDAQDRVSLSAEDVVLDIGSNDGTLLRYFSNLDLTLVGVEPANNLREEGEKGLTHFINDFWSLEPYMRIVGKRAKVITALGMFYDMDDPNQFIADVEKALTDDGIFIAQLMCLSNMIKSNDVGNICHEHLEYYSFKSLEFLFNRNHLEIVDVESNSVNGGSYRIFAKKISSTGKVEAKAAARVEKVRIAEKYLEEKSTYYDFFSRLEENKRRCITFIGNAVAKGQRVWVYGASTKGNVILQYYGLDRSLIEAAAERSPWKWGKYTVGSMIPCVTEEEARDAQPDYFLVLPYAFFDEFFERERDWRGRGGKFIVPLPEFRVIG